MYNSGGEQEQMIEQMRGLSNEVDNLRTKLNSDALLVASENGNRLDKALSSMSLAQHFRMVVFVAIVGVLASIM